MVLAEGVRTGNNSAHNPPPPSPLPPPHPRLVQIGCKFGGPVRDESTACSYTPQCRKFADTARRRLYTGRRRRSSRRGRGKKEGWGKGGGRRGVGEKKAPAVIRPATEPVLSLFANPVVSMLRKHYATNLGPLRSQYFMRSLKTKKY
jgi:hypothetical protein